MFIRYFSKPSTKAYATLFAISTGALATQYYLKKFTNKNTIEFIMSSPGGEVSELPIDGFNYAIIKEKDEPKEIISEKIHYSIFDENDDELRIIAPIRKTKHILKNIPLKQLPYADEPLLDSENPSLKQHQITRMPFLIVVYRGDSRSPSEIKAVGGFHPRCTMQNKENQASLDVIAHRIGLSPSSAYVSTTLDPGVAHRIGIKRFSYTIYALAAAGPMGPSKEIHPEEEECSQPGGFDWEDVIAYRNCKIDHVSPMYERRITYATCGDVFFRSKFAKQNLSHAEKIVNSLLFQGESIDQGSYHYVRSKQS